MLRCTATQAACMAVCWASARLARWLLSPLPKQHYADAWGWNFTTSEELQVRWWAVFGGPLRQLPPTIDYSPTHLPPVVCVTNRCLPTTHPPPACQLSLPHSQDLVDSLPPGLALEGIMVR